MKLSAVVPVYNGAGCLERCLESIRVSSVAGGNATLELVIVDDASTDATPRIIERFRQHIPEFVVARHETNLGLGEARNTGLAHATGEWVAWVDADDAVAPEWFARLAESVGGDVDVVTFGSRLWRGERARELRYRPDVCIVDALTFCCDALRDLGTSSWMWNKMFRRSLFDGLSFSGRCQEDFRMLPHVLARARRVCSIPDALYDYYRPAGSLSRHGDRSGSVEGLKASLDIDWCAAGLPASVQAAWQEGIALRAADYLRNSGDEPIFRRYLRRNLHRVLLNPRQSLRQKVKCLIEAVRFR